MRIEQVAVQLYTVRDRMKTRAEAESTLKRIRQIGYRAVELAGNPDASDEEFGKMMADAGLVCCSSHEGGDRLLEDPTAVIGRLRTFGCRFVALPHPASRAFDHLTDVLALAKRLNHAGKAYREAGITLTYHNHALEFRRFGRRLMLDVLYEETNPEYLQGEPDTYWIQYGGGDPVAWCRKLKGRLPLLHMKDYKIDADQRPTFAEVGEGNLDWKAIIAAAEESGCEWFIVEQDRCDRDPLEAIQVSFEHIRDTLCA